jgi:hypothetical protein
MRIKLSQIAATLKYPPSLFVCAASFEDRCRIVAEHLDPRYTHKVLIFENTDYAEHIETNAVAIKNHFRANVQRVPIRTDDPLKVADKFRDELVPSINETSGLCLVDVTTFTHEQLLILIRLLIDATPQADLKFIYNHASAYSTNTDPDSFWLSKGVAKIRSVLGFPGEMLPSRKNHLLVLTGYEYERAEKLISRLEPNLISLGLGRKDSQGKNLTEHERNKILNDYLESFVEELSVSITSVCRFEFSTSDPVTARDDILRQCKKFAPYNVLVAPMNTKLSTIGAGLAAVWHPQIQLTYALPITYNLKGYSVPSDTCTLFDLSHYLQVTQS